MKCTANLGDHPSSDRASAQGRRDRKPHGLDGSNRSSDGSRALRASSLQGEFWFRLQRNSGGLYVEREERPRRGSPCVQSVHFDEPRDFERWCDDDPIRFEHPRLHVALKRDAEELWQLGTPED